MQLARTIFQLSKTSCVSLVKAVWLAALPLAPWELLLLLLADDCFWMLNAGQRSELIENYYFHGEVSIHVVHRWCLQYSKYMSFLPRSICQNITRQTINQAHAGLNHTLQDFWPGGIPSEAVWSPNHTQRGAWYINEARMLLPRLHQIFPPWPTALGAVGALTSVFHIDKAPPNQVTPLVGFPSLCTLCSHWLFFSGVADPV